MVDCSTSIDHFLNIFIIFQELCCHLMAIKAHRILLRRYTSKHVISVQMTALIWCWTHSTLNHCGSTAKTRYDSQKCLKRNKRMSLLLSIKTKFRIFQLYPYLSTAESDLCQNRRSICFPRCLERFLFRYQSSSCSKSSILNCNSCKLLNQCPASQCPFHPDLKES